jgi:hypothetical protein
MSEAKGSMIRAECQRRRQPDYKGLRQRVAPRERARQEALNRSGYVLLYNEGSIAEFDYLRAKSGK